MNVFKKDSFIHLLLSDIIFTLGYKTKFIKYNLLQLIGSFLEVLSLPLISTYLLFAIDEASVQKYTQTIGEYTGIDITLINFSIFIVLFVLFKNYYLFMVDNYTAHTNMKIYNSIVKKLLDGYLNSKYLYRNKLSSSEFLNVIINETNSTVVNIMTAFVTIFKELFIILFILTLLFYFNFISTLLIIIYFAIIFLFIKYLILDKLDNYGKRKLLLSEKRINQILDIINNHKLIDLYNKKTYFLNSFNKTQKEFSFVAIYPFVLKLIPRYILEVLIFSIIPIGFILSSFDDTINKEYILLVLIAATRLLPSINRIISSLSEIQTFKKSLEKIVKFNKDFMQNAKLLKAVQDKIYTKKNNLIVSDIRFSYNKSSFDMHSINMDIFIGDTIAIVGPSGGGKTTLVNLIMGLIDPDKGHIKFDEYDIDSVINSNHIAYVSQNLTIINDMLVKNIAFGCKESEIDYDKVSHSLKQAHLDKFVQKLPEGINTIISESSNNISGGEKQRIAFARALYFNPKILILDEFTSALDTDTEDNIIKELEFLKKDMIIIIVAHRLNSIKNVDKIFYIDNGTILESGTYEQLIQKKGKFFHLVEQGGLI